MNQNIPPARPEKLQVLSNEDDNEPLYMTTIPHPYEAPDVPPRPPYLLSPKKSQKLLSPKKSQKLVSPNKSPKRGILKNGVKDSPKITPSRNSTKISNSAPNIFHEKNVLLTSEDVGHFDFTVHEPHSVASKENNNQRFSKRIEQKKTREAKQCKDNLGINIKTYPPDWAERGNRAAKVESMVGIIHLLVIIFSIVTVAMMAKLTGEWENKRRRCPLYVKNTPNVDLYWGNEKMAPCHFAAFMPVLILIMSFTLIIFHGGILWSWRSGGDISKLLLSKKYPKVLFGLEFFEFLVSLTVAGVITDGFRQTCVGFQLTPWLDQRPDTCKEGYYERDDAYDISKTYSRIVGSIVTSWFTSILLFTSVTLFFMRAKFCRNTKF